MSPTPPDRTRPRRPAPHRGSGMRTVAGIVCLALGTVWLTAQATPVLGGLDAEIEAVFVRD
ncbi:hypothetical protein JQC91_01270 [Jannaschia sp. Os4]|uniref:hypothetical protein n=1 Tax=Jannaschia sp. Os4 TaxID=2807617 RepID=UPI00193A90CB|nr:hypothetical protein [Jannaschia sp. Os4]MBM2574922.1 hypothetical protein [Jannaschia sp. Os4]